MKGDELTGFRSISSWNSPFLEARVPAREIKPDWKLSSGVTQPHVEVKVEQGTSFQRLAGCRVCRKQAKQRIVNSSLQILICDRCSHDKKIGRG